ncbi:MAG: LptF/LptG family permease [Candidatus Gastranaerophilales bacterium]|nr:LptF/LptG family permease [Candidatus Gastranaerophilales bacterium]
MKKINLSILDKYILKQITEIFVFGVLIFTSIIFASDTFTTLIKQISTYGMPVKVAFMMILLNLPSVMVMTIPISVLFATVMTVNRMCLASELTVLRACGVSINRIAKPIFLFAVCATLVTFLINETVVPITTQQSKYLAMWSITQRHIPKGKKNFTLKELQNGIQLKRFFYVENCEDEQFHNVSILDVSDPQNIQIIQAKTGTSVDKGWNFKDASVYTITPKGKNLSTSWFESTVVDFGSEVNHALFAGDQGRTHNFFELSKILINDSKNTDSADKLTDTERIESTISLWDKTAFPLTSVVLVLLGVPLAITPPRVRYNRGFLFSILIIFFYYLVRAFSISFGQSEVLLPILAAWLPNVVIGSIGLFLYYKRAYTI